MSLHCPTTVLLARHGEAAYELPTWSDEGGCLTAQGRDQASNLGEALRGRNIAHVYSSTMARAVQTAELASGRHDVDVTTRRELDEFGVGDCTDEPRDHDPFAATFRRWLDGETAARVPGGEAGAQVVQRGRRVLQEVADAHPGRTVLVVAHGGILTLLVRHTLRNAAGVAPRPFGNCAYAETSLGADGWLLTGWQEAPADPAAGPER